MDRLCSFDTYTRQIRKSNLPNVYCSAVLLRGAGTCSNVVSSKVHKMLVPCFLHFHLTHAYLTLGMLLLCVVNL